ncbi:MAG: hypothetical protein M1269_08995 [Chloroflexi bacterium]|nr:hypothetical protein [Chloroflexota bacterium]
MKTVEFIESCIGRLRSGKIDKDQLMKLLEPLFSKIAATYEEYANEFITDEEMTEEVLKGHWLLMDGLRDFAGMMEEVMFYYEDEDPIHLDIAINLVRDGEEKLQQTVKNADEVAEQAKVMRPFYNKLRTSITGKVDSSVYMEG